MRSLVALNLLVAAGLAVPAPIGAQATDRMNPIIALQEKGLPVLGIAHPAIVPRGPGRGRGPAPDPAAPPPPAIVLGDAAKETVGYTRADYLYTSGTSDTFLRYIEEIRKAGLKRVWRMRPPIGGCPSMSTRRRPTCGRSTRTAN